jgi:hypothetical protein
VSEEAELNIKDIHNLLFAKKKLQLEFASEAEAEKFRVQLAQFKARSDKQLIELGLLEENEKQRLSFKVQGKLGLEDNLLLDMPSTVTATIKYEDKVTQKQFKVRILGDDDGEGAS